MNWLIAIALVGVLLIAGCAVLIQAASDTAEDVISFAVRVQCYDNGYSDGVRREMAYPPSDELPGCAPLYADGYEDGRAGKYDPPVAD